MTRPATLVVVVGTATEVGKTWASCAITSGARARGADVAARKPVQSFDPPTAAAGRTDAHLLAAATGEDVHQVCPPHRWYERAYAPPMAADALGRPSFTVAELAAEIEWPNGGCDLGVVETAGALRSPIAADGDSLSLTLRLEPDVVLLVAHAGLGTIGWVRPAAESLAGVRTVVLLNRFDADDDLHRRNARWLGEHDGHDVVTSAAAALHSLGAATRGASPRTSGGTAD